MKTAQILQPVWKYDPTVQREALFRAKDELVYLPALRINKTKHENIYTLDTTENIAISAL